MLSIRCLQCDALVQQVSSDSKNSNNEKLINSKTDSYSTVRMFNVQSILHGLPTGSVYTDAYSIHTKNDALATGGVNIHHSMCSDCVNLLYKELNDRIADQHALETGIRDHSWQEHVSNLNNRIKKLGQKLETLKIEDDRDLDDEEFALEQAKKQLEEDEKAYWERFREVCIRLDTLSEEQDALITKTELLTTNMELLQPAHAFNDAFYIWRQGDYGTINGFRLGMLFGQSKRSKAPGIVERCSWEEVNTAWGLTAMLMNAITQTSKFVCKRYQIHALGPRSTIISCEKKNASYRFLSNTVEEYPLYYLETPGTLMDRLTKTKRIDHFNFAMRAFLACVKEFAEYAMQSESGRTLELRKKMYSMDAPQLNDGLARKHSCTINGDIIDVEFVNTEDIEESFRWTVALRHLLTNLKWLLVWSVVNTK